MAWGKAGSTTLTGAGDTITISDQTSTKFNTSMYSGSGSGGAVQWRRRYGNSTIDTGSNYADRYSTNGGTDSTTTSQSSIFAMNSGAGVHFMMHIDYTINISSEEKLTILHVMWQGASGATNAPERAECVGKWTNTSNQYDNVQVVNINAGDFAADSNLSAIGSDITPAAAVPFPTNVQVGSRAEITDSRKMYSLEIAPTYEDDFSSYADQSSADAAWVSNDTADFRVNVTNDNLDFNSKVTSTTNTGIYYDLGTALSDTAWTMDFKLVITTNTLYSSGSVSAATYITMNDTNNGGAIGGTVDAMGFYISAGSSGSKFNVTWANSSFLNRGGGVFSGTITTGTFYMRLKRTGATSVKLEVYSDAARTTLIEEKEVTGTDSGITGLQYIRIQDNQSSAGTGTGQTIGTIDDIKIYDGVTSPSSSTNYAWQEIGA